MSSTPSEVTANSVVSEPHPPSDSAPPPSSVSPSTSVQLPSRTYSNEPVSIRPPPAYAPNSSVPNFIRFLATLLFLGGSISAAVAWFYKSIVVPRLILALKAKTKLFDYHKIKYTELWQTLTEFTDSASCQRLGGTRAVELRKKQQRQAGTTEEGQDESDKDLLLPDSTLAAGEGKRNSGLPRAPRLLVPLETSLSNLHESLSNASTAPTAKQQPPPTLLGQPNPSNLVQPQGQLLRSFVTFNEYLESELQSVSSSSNTLVNPYRTYGANTTVTSSSGVTSGGGGGGERKALQEATQGFKAEIRSIKGALLNRRNFVRPGEGVVGA